MTMPSAGWYPDPAGSEGLRWWDGASWGEQVQPAARPVAQPAPQPWGITPAAPPQGDAGSTAAQQWGATQPHAAPKSFLQRNVNSLLVAGLAVVCVLIARTTGYIVFAFVPAFVSARAVQGKEPLAWPAVGIAVALVIWRFRA
jgi:hypothetical protein